jgi:CheY-like chemotaxis protein
VAALAPQRPVILIVEDEFVIRMATAEAIRDAGFQVVEAPNADSAIAILESRSDIQVVFTDITCRDRWTERGWPTLLDG